MSRRSIDPITLAVVSSALDTIVDEMAYTVMRTSRSPLVRDVLDYSCTLCDATGRILTQAKTVALHLGAVPDAIGAVLEEYDGTFAPGDIVILNDPYQGGMHLPDIFMFKPIFHGGDLRGFSVVITHHCDMGGRVPGSNAADSTEIFQEGLRIPPLKLYEAGVRCRALFDIIAKNVRVPDLVIGDIESQIATCNIGERDFIALLERYGADALADYFDELIDYGETLTRSAIADWPDGEYRFTDYIDGDGFTREQIPITVTLTVDGGHLTVDFAGSSPQVRGAINSTLSYTKSSTYLAVRCALDRKVPNNAGVYRCITVKAPLGSILNPQLPAPVAARALTGYRTVDTVMGALAQVVPGNVRAAGEGGNTVVCFGGYDKETREPFIMVDMINGAWGARADADGIEGVTNPSQNMSNMPIETLEQRYPVLMEEYGFREDSCGAGRYRGGLGLVRQYRLLADEAILQLRSDRYVNPPYGLDGGGAAAPARNVFNPDGAREDLPSKVTRTVRSGDVLRHEQPGGGGHGDPLLRPPKDVAADVLDEKISRAFAVERFGVVFAAGSCEPDMAATESRRTEMAAARSGRDLSQTGQRSA